MLKGSAPIVKGEGFAGAAFGIVPVVIPGTAYKQHNCRAERSAPDRESRSKIRLSTERADTVTKTVPAMKLAISQPITGPTISHNIRMR